MPRRSARNRKPTPKVKAEPTVAVKSDESVEVIEHPQTPVAKRIFYDDEVEVIKKVPPKKKSPIPRSTPDLRRQSDPKDHVLVLVSPSLLFLLPKKSASPKASIGSARARL